MDTKRHVIALLLMVFLLIFAGTAPSGADILTQCPGDINGDAIPDEFLLDGGGNPIATPNPEYNPNVECIHVVAGDGFIKLADGDRCTFSAMPMLPERWKKT